MKKVISLITMKEEQDDFFFIKKEIRKLKEMKEQDGISIIPLKIFFSKNYAKLLIGVCKGKKLYDKRESIKKRDLERENKYLY